MGLDATKMSPERGILCISCFRRGAYRSDGEWSGIRMVTAGTGAYSLRIIRGVLG